MIFNKGVQADFAKNALRILEKDSSVVGLAAGGSWLTNEMDEFSDLDLILISKQKISSNKEKMLSHAAGLGTLLSAFTGEHVGDSRVLICLYDNPLLHVDIKFLTIEEFGSRVETPVLLLDKGGELKKVLDSTEAEFPVPDFQWIEDRFWVWIHYVLMKIGRGEYFESVDFFTSLRKIVIGPMLHMKVQSEPRGVRKLEFLSSLEDIGLLKTTIPGYDKQSLLLSVENSVLLYRKLRLELFTSDIALKKEAEEKVMLCYKEISSK